MEEVEESTEGDLSLEGTEVPVVDLHLNERRSGV